MYEYVFFDLDGTLTDPREGITKSVQYALAHMGIEEPDLKKLEVFIGPPLIPAFMEFYGMTEEEARKTVGFYRERFSTIGLFENIPFDGVKEMLSSLKESGKILAVASSKPEKFVCQILEHFNLDHYFHEICGSLLNETRTKKEEVLEELLERLHLPKAAPKGVLMVGDRKHDVEGAKEFGIPCLGVSFGFAPEGELEAAGALDIVDTMKELENFVINGGR